MDQCHSCLIKIGDNRVTRNLPLPVAIGSFVLGGLAATVALVALGILIGGYIYSAFGTTTAVLKNILLTSSNIAEWSGIACCCGIGLGVFALLIQRVQIECERIKNEKN